MKSGLDATLWARITQNVKKPPLKVNVIDFEFFGFNVSKWVFGVPLVPKSHDTLVELFRFIRYWERKKVHLLHFTEITIKHFPTFLTSGPLVNKQQKRGEYVENIKFSLDTQLNFILSTFSPVFCCLSTRRPEVSSCSAFLDLI
jgi:hypothetical protein